MHSSREYERIHSDNEIEENSWLSIFLSSVFLLWMDDFCYVPSYNATILVPLSLLYTVAFSSTDRPVVYP